MHSHLVRFTWPVVILAALVAAEPSDAPDGRDWSAYEIIVERNIFSRTRGQRRQAPQAEGGPSRPVVVPNPESYFVLKGIVRQNAAYIAFVEDTRDGQVLRVRQGDDVARGTVKNLTLDALEYQIDDRTVSVELGYNLEGGFGTAAVSVDDWYDLSQTAAPSDGPEDTAEPPAPTGDEADILRQLMERRQQELNQ